MMAQAQSTLNFPKLFSAGELPVSGFAIVNPGQTTATVNFKLYSAAGAVIDSKDQTYSPGTQRARSGSEIFTTSLGSGGWVQATSTTPGLQGFWLNFDGAVTYIDGAEAAAAALDQVIPLVAGATELNVANPGAASNSVTIRLFGEAGELGTATQTIAANGVFQGSVATLFPAASIGSARYIRVTGALPVASAALVRGYLVPQDTAVVNGVDRTSTLTQMNFPHVVSGVGGGGNYTTEVGVTNLSATAQTVTISFTPEAGGAATSVTRQLAANGALRETAQSLFSFPAAFQNGWIRVQGTSPIAGFVAYADSVAGGVAVVSVQETPRTQLLFAHIADLVPFYTGLAVLNTNSATASVTVSAMTPDGTLIGTGNFSLASNAKTAKLLLELIPATQTRTSDGGFIFVSSSVPLYGIELFFNRNLSSISNVAAGTANYTPPPPPQPLTLTSVAPTRVAVNTAVVLSGTGFSTTASNVTVLFTSASGTVSATATTSTATSVTATVPASAITGPVRVQTGGQTSGAVILQVMASATDLLPPATVTVGAAATTTGVDIYVPPPAASGANITQIGISDTAGACCSVGQSSIEIARGQTKFIAVNGTGISAANGSRLTISGTGVTISAVNISGTALFATVAVDASAPTGIRNVTITNSNLDTSVLSGGLFIR